MFRSKLGSISIWTWTLSIVSIRLEKFTNITDRDVFIFLGKFLAFLVWTTLTLLLQIVTCKPRWLLRTWSVNCQTCLGQLSTYSISLVLLSQIILKQASLLICMLRPLYYSTPLILSTKNFSSPSQRFNTQILPYPTINCRTDISFILLELCLHFDNVIWPNF